MSVTVVTPAANQDLTTVGAIKQELGLTTPDEARDARLGALIRRASAAIVTFCRRRTFARQTYLETLKGSGDTTLLVSETPIVQVTSVTEDGSAITDYSIDDAEIGTITRERGFRLSESFGSPFRDWPLAGTQEADIAVQYDAGYYLPGDATAGSPAAPTLPPDLEQACILTVKDWYLRAGETPGATIKSKRVDDLSIDYADGLVAAGQIPTPAAALLSPYIRET